MIVELSIFLPLNQEDNSGNAYGNNDNDNDNDNNNDSFC